jgi:hypothetical protein
MSDGYYRLYKAKLIKIKSSSLYINKVTFHVFPQNGAESTFCSSDFFKAEQRQRRPMLQRRRFGPNNGFGQSKIE